MPQRVLFRRILGRGTKIARKFTDIPLRRALQSRARPSRTVLPLDDLPYRSALVVVAHPDDEVLAAGVLLGRLPHAGVICVTDGAPLDERYARAAGFDNRLDYALARRKEAGTALAILQRDIAPMQNLGVVDQQGIFSVVSLSRYLMQRMRSGYDCVITHAYEGGHPDHDATALAVHAACALISKKGGAPPAIVEAALYNAPDEVFTYSEFVPHADAGSPVSFALSPEEQALKRQMLACHHTQSEVFAAFNLEREIFRIAPRYHFSAPPHAGDVGFNQFSWGLDGKMWRSRAWDAMRELDLLRELA
jgi:LmbE family N-acetylglucosaminyl deacetylase